MDQSSLKPDAGPTATTPGEHRWPWLGTLSVRTLLGICLTALAVLMAGQLGMALGGADSYFSPFWPLSAAAVISLMLGGWWMVVGIYIGVAASNVLWHLTSLTTWFGPFGIIFEASATWWLITWLVGPRARLTDMSSCFAFLLVPLLPVALNGLLATGLLHVEKVTDSTLLGGEWAMFLMANAGAIILLVPAFAVWTGRPDAAWWKSAAIFGVVTLALAAAIFTAPGTISPYLLLLPLLGASIRLGLRGAAPLVAAVTLGGVAATRLGYGPFAGQALTDAFASLYFFLALVAISVLPVAAVIERLQQRLQRARFAAGGQGLIVWWWDQTSGLHWDKLSETCPLTIDATPSLSVEKLFVAEQDRGLHETELSGQPVLSVWEINERDDQGMAISAHGLLLEAHGTLGVGATQRRARESEIELRNIRASLTPHLLFNCLAAVRGIVRTDPERARSFIDRLARFLRDNTNAQTRETIPLLDEWQLCEDFLALQSMRYERELPRLVEIEGAAYHARLPPMILLNLVENAVKHGIVDQQHPLVVTVHLDGDHIEAEVRNEGLLGPIPTSRPGGLGTARARLIFMYGEEGLLDIKQDHSHVVAKVRLPSRSDDQPLTAG